MWQGIFEYLNFEKGGKGSGIKGHHTYREEIRKPPNPVLLDGLQNFYNPQPTLGISNLNPETGTFIFTKKEINEKGKLLPTDKKFRIEGRRFILESDGTSVEVPKKNITEIAQGMKLSGSNKAFSELFTDSYIRTQYKEIMSDYEGTLEKIKFFDDYVPRYEDIAGEGKYSSKMNLKRIEKIPKPVETIAPLFWYDGNSGETAIVGEAIQDIVSGNMNKKDLFQIPLFLAMEASRKVNRNHHTDFVYRGETNVKSAKALIEGVVKSGEIGLENKLFSTSESEQLGKWYAAVHKQETARGTNSKTNVMLKIPYEKYKNNVALDYKAVGSNINPEREITIFGNGMKLTGDDIMVRGKVPARKNAGWMTLSKFIEDGGDVEGFIGDMWEEEA